MDDVKVNYRCSSRNKKPHFLKTKEIQKVAGEVRNQIVKPDCRKMSVEDLLNVQKIVVNQVPIKIVFDLEFSPSNDETIFGMCDYDSHGAPDTVFISLNKTIQLLNYKTSTAAHELGHAIFDMPPLVHRASQPSLFPLFDKAIESDNCTKFRVVTSEENHLAFARNTLVENNSLTRKREETTNAVELAEIRANTFMGALLVPEKLLTCTIEEISPKLNISLQPTSELLSNNDTGGVMKILCKSKAQINTLVSMLAEIFGVSKQFIAVRLCNYKLLNQEEINHFL